MTSTTHFGFALKLTGDAETTERFDSIESLLAGRVSVKRRRFGDPRGDPKRATPLYWDLNILQIGVTALEDQGILADVQMRAERLLEALTPVWGEFREAIAGLPCELYIGATVLGDISSPSLDLKPSTLRPFLEIVDLVSAFVSNYLSPNFDEDGDCRFCRFHAGNMAQPREEQ